MYVFIYCFTLKRFEILVDRTLHTYLIYSGCQYMGADCKLTEFNVQYENFINFYQLICVKFVSTGYFSTQSSILTVIHS